MPDYASILRRSISALPDASPAMREAVYQRARAALARQLTAVDPPLSAREIEAQHQDLEDAVVRLEAEFAPDELDTNEPDKGAEDEFFYPAGQAGGASHAQNGLSAYGQGSTASYAPPPVAAAPPMPSSAYGDERQDRSDRQDYDSEIEDEDEDEGEFDDEDERTSRAPLLVGVLLAVLVVGGAATLVYSERGTILSAVGLGSGDGVAVTEETEAPPQVAAVEPEQDPDAAEDPTKHPDRLANGEAPPPLLEEPEVASTEPASPVLPADETPAQPLGPDSAVGFDEQQTAAVEPGQSIVAQRAIFYFQGTEGTPGRATEGTVAWREISRDDGPAVQATLQLPEQEVTATVTIYRNDDASLPASHLVEVLFEGDLGPSQIQRVPALVMKQTEQARGEPLTGAAVPVTSDLFWIALSDDAEQVPRNLQLLREGSWFDIPILFEDGTRALLTFEKGIPGDRVFETVMASWTPEAPVQ